MINDAWSRSPQCLCPPEEGTIKPRSSSLLSGWVWAAPFRRMAALQEKKSCSQRMEEFQRYCWNPDTGQMLGRTLSRWGTCLGVGGRGGRDGLLGGHTQTSHQQSRPQDPDPARASG